MKKDITYIKTGLDQNIAEHKDIRKDQKGLMNKFDDFIKAVDKKFDNKADKREVQFLKTKLLNAVTALIVLLLGIIGFLIKNDLYPKKP